MGPAGEEQYNRYRGARTGPCLVDQILGELREMSGLSRAGLADQQAAMVHGRSQQVQQGGAGRQRLTGAEAHQAPGAPVIEPIR